jgi:hypothetical protein
LQDGHADLPVLLLNVPSGHSSHADAAPVENVPSTHGWHDELAFSPEKVPGGHCRQKDMFCFEYSPFWHCWQIVAPKTSEKEPDGHTVQFVLAFWFEKVPCRHRVQMLVSVPAANSPAGQAMQDVAWISEYLPASHGSHTRFCS